MRPEYTPSVLIADPDRGAREALRHACVEVRHVVADAATGRAALEHLARELPDVVVVDLALVEPDGWAVCESIKADPQTREIPLIVLARNATDESRLRALRLGAYDVLSKPISAQELVHRIALVVERTHSGSAVGEGRRSYLAGHTSQMSIPDLVQMLSINTRTGCLRVRSTTKIGRIHFREGRIVDAFSGRARGRKALFRVLGEQDADFHFDPQDDPSLATEMKGSTQGLLMDALVAQDDLSRVLRELPSWDAPLARNVQNGEAPQVDGSLVTVARDVLDAMRTARNLRQLFETVESTDVEIARALAELMKSDAVVAVG